MGGGMGLPGAKATGGAAGDRARVTLAQGRGTREEGGGPPKGGSGDEVTTPGTAD